MGKASRLRRLRLAGETSPDDRPDAQKSNGGSHPSPGSAADQMARMASAIEQLQAHRNHILSHVVNFCGWAASEFSDQKLRDQLRAFAANCGLKLTPEEICVKMGIAPKGTITLVDGAAIRG